MVYCSFSKSTTKALEDYVQFELNAQHILGAKYRDLVASVICEATENQDVEVLAMELADYYVELRFSMVPLIEEENRHLGNPYQIYSRKVFQKMVANTPAGSARFFLKNAFSNLFRICSAEIRSNAALEIARINKHLSNKFRYFKKRFLDTFHKMQAEGIALTICHYVVN